MLAHQILLLFFFFMFESLCGGTLSKAKKFNKRTILQIVLKGKVMRRLLDFIALDRISFQLLSHQNLWGRHPNLAPVAL